MKKLVIILKSSNFIPLFLVDKDAYAIGKQIHDIMATFTTTKLYELKSEENYIATVISSEIAGFYISEFVQSPQDRAALAMEKMVRDEKGE
jgi:hypothetical protein